MSDWLHIGPGKQRCLSAPPGILDSGRGPPTFNVIGILTWNFNRLDFLLDFFLPKGKQHGAGISDNYFFPFV